MKQCRICLKTRKKLISLQDKYKDRLSYYYMMTTISNVKVFLENVSEKSSQLCLLCSRRLKDAYEFKLLIEKSDAFLRNCSSTKRITFNNLNEIKLEIEIPSHSTEQPSIDIVNNLNRNKENCFIYKDIIITKIENVKEEKGQIHVDEFLNSIENEADYCTDDKCGDYDEEYVPENQVKKYNYTKKNSSKHISGKENSNLIHVDKPIIPVFIPNLRVQRTLIRKDKPKKKCPKKLRKDICPLCGKWVTAIKFHMMTHSEKKFQCNKCLKAFATQITLNAHIKLHRTSRLFKCDSCIASFKTKDSLKNHQLVHTDKKNFMCDACNKYFRKKCHLTRHNVLVHDIGGTRHPCELCPKVCKSNASLRHHLRIHTRERPFKCEICSQPYSYKADFNRHCLKKHGVVIKLRPIYVMNEEVLKAEKDLMKNIAQNLQSVFDDINLRKQFEGPQGYQALEHTIKAIESRQVPLNL